MKRVLHSLVFLLSAASITGVYAANQGWESFVKEGNLEFDRGRFGGAVRQYNQALKVLSRQRIDDIRLAIVYKDIFRAKRALLKLHDARLFDNRGAKIYKQEIDNRQLGSEYSSKEPVDLSQVVLKPACPVCHENYKVVPIRYGKDTGYEGETPPETSIKFTHKPGGAEVACERWYCKGCMQRF